MSIFLAWNTGTGIGAIAGHALVDPHRLGIDFVAPLTFLAVLVPLVRTRAAALAALVVASLAGRPDDFPLRLVALAGTGLAVRQTRRVWVGILGGMALYVLLRLA